MSLAWLVMVLAVDWELCQIASVLFPVFSACAWASPSLAAGLQWAGSERCPSSYGSEDLAHHFHHILYCSSLIKRPAQPRGEAELPPLLHKKKGMHAGGHLWKLGTQWILVQSLI